MSMTDDGFELLDSCPRCEGPAGCHLGHMRSDSTWSCEPPRLSLAVVLGTEGPGSFVPGVRPVLGVRVRRPRQAGRRAR